MLNLLINNYCGYLYFKLSFFIMQDNTWTKKNKDGFLPLHTVLKIIPVALLKLFIHFCGHGCI